MGRPDHWRCCGCSHGWFSVALDDYCPNCARARCDYCYYANDGPPPQRKSRNKPDSSSRSSEALAVSLLMVNKSLAQTGTKKADDTEQSLPKQPILSEGVTDKPARTDSHGARMAGKINTTARFSATSSTEANSQGRTASKLTWGTDSQKLADAERSTDDRNTRSEDMKEKTEQDKVQGELKKEEGGMENAIVATVSVPAVLSPPSRASKQTLEEGNRHAHEADENKHPIAKHHSRPTDTKNQRNTLVEATCQKAKLSDSQLQQQPLEATHYATQESRTPLYNWFVAATRVIMHVKNSLSDKLQRKVSEGVSRISWTCRCGKRLRLEVPSSQQGNALSFATLAAGSSGTSSISVETCGDISTSTSSSTVAATSSTASTSSRKHSAGLSARSPSSSLEGDELQSPYIPAGTAKYMLLCVNSGMRPIKLANVDVTDIEDDGEMFRRLRASYYQIRGSRGHNLLFKPKTMYYIKFQLLFLRKSGECLRNYEINSIPSIKEVLNQEYAFHPYKPLLGDLPIPPQIFMHSFLEDGDHLGRMAMEMLPKKLWQPLAWKYDVNNINVCNLPYGWGFYIVEGLDLALVAWCVAVIMTVVTIVVILWSVLNQDVQGGSGIGQYCIGLLAVGISVAVLIGNLPGSVVK